MVVGARCLAAASSDAVVSKPDAIPVLVVDSRVIDRSASIVRSYVGDEFFTERLQFRSLSLRDSRGAVTYSCRDRPVSIRIPGIPVAGAQQVDPGPDNVQFEANYYARPEVYYEVVWEIRFPDRPPLVAAFDVDLDGRLLSNPNELHLPRCAESPASCNYKVTFEEARDIALKALGKPDYNGSPDFLYSEDWDRFVFAVKVWPRSEHDRVPCPNCQMAIIDAATGAVLLTGKWSYRGNGWK